MIRLNGSTAQRLNGSTAQRLVLGWRRSIGKLSLLCLIGLSSLPVNIANPSPAFGSWTDFIKNPFTPPTASGLKICNLSAASFVNVAIGYNKLNAGWWSEGWWKIPRNECRKVIGVPLVRDNYYYYAKGYNSQGEYSGHTWEGSAKFCIQSSRFNMGESQACLRERSADFVRVSTGRMSGYTIRLTSS